MEEGASPPRCALDKKLGEDASMEEKKEGEKEGGGSTKLKEEKGREVEL